jgi:hypothetical protein
MEGVKRNADWQQNVEMGRLINDSDARKQPLEILEQKISVFEEPEHAQIHANAGNKPPAFAMRILRLGNLAAEPEIHASCRKEQRGKWRVPRAVKNVACDYEKIFSRVPGTNTPVGGDDDYKKDDERQRIEEHGGRAIAYSRGTPIASINLPAIGRITFDLA